MKKKAILTFKGRKPRSKSEYSLIVENIKISDKPHLIIDLYNKKELIYRIAINEREFAHYDYGYKKWNVQTGYANRYRTEIKKAIISDKDYAALRRFSKILMASCDKREVIDIVESIEAHIDLQIMNKKANREAIERESLFELIPEIPTSFLQAIDRNVNDKNIIYYKRKGSRADYYCCQCGETFSRRFCDEPDMQFMCHAFIPIPKRQMQDKCDLCGKTATLLQMGYAKNTYQEFKTILYQTAEDGTLIARGFYTSAKRGEYAPVNVTTREFGRMFMKRGKIRSYHQYEADSAWYKNKHLALNGKGVITSFNYENAVADSDLKYIPPEMYKLICESGFEKYKIQALTSYANAPQLEVLYKIGLYGICRQIMWQQGSTREINKKSTKASDILRLTKEEYNYLIKNFKKEGDIRIFNMIKFARKNNVCINQFNRLLPLYSHYEEHSLERALKYQSSEKLRNYLDKQLKDYQSYSDLIREYADYLLERSAAGYDLNNSVYLRPRSLHESYTRVRLDEEQKRDNDYIYKMDEKYSKIKEYALKIPKKYTWQQYGLVIKPAMSAGEIILEGRVLHHCVGSDNQRYMKNYNKNKAWIMVIRKADKLDTPFVTVELQDDEIIQWYGAHDTKPDEEHVEMFLEEYLKHITTGREKTA